MNQPMKELPRYKSHKIVHALKIHNIDVDTETGAAVITPADDGYGPFAVDAEYMTKHKPRYAGYYVVYEDGYKSWSPADAFENGYTKVDGKISEPLNKSMERLEEFWSKNGIDPLAPEESSRGPLSQLKAALKSDDDYAWTWLCNLACFGLDSGGTHENSNRRAAQFMKNAFDIDVTQCENWKQFELQWSEPPEVDQTLDEWMQAYDAAVESGQSRISREEAEKRYEAKYGRNRQQNDDY